MIGLSRIFVDTYLFRIMYIPSVLNDIFFWIFQVLMRLSTEPTLPMLWSPMKGVAPTFHQESLNQHVKLTSPGSHLMIKNAK